MLTAEFQRLMAERDFIYNQEEEYLKLLGDIRTLYLRKKDFDSKSQKPPLDLVDRIRSDLKSVQDKKNRIDTQKITFSSKFEKAKYGVSASSGNPFDASRSIVAPLSGNMMRASGIKDQMDNLTTRIAKLEDLKNNQRLNLLAGSMPISAQVLETANGGGAEALARAQLEAAMRNPNIQDRAAGLSALRTSLEMVGSRLKFLL
jgi:hypothetical protein